MKIIKNEGPKEKTNRISERAEDELFPNGLITSLLCSFQICYSFEVKRGLFCSKTVEYQRKDSQIGSDE